MIDSTKLILLIFGMFAVTYPARLIPFAFSNRMQLPNVIKIWLGYVPVSVFAALLTQVFAGAAQTPAKMFDQLPLFVSCIASTLIAARSRSIGWGMGAGFGLFVLLTLLGHVCN